MVTAKETLSFVMQRTCHQGRKELISTPLFTYICAELFVVIVFSLYAFLSLGCAATLYIQKVEPWKMGLRIVINSFHFDAGDVMKLLLSWSCVL